MTVLPTPLRIVATAHFAARYRRAPSAVQTSCDRVILAVAEGNTTPEQRVKPILPSKRYLEARWNRGDRLIFRIDAQDLLLVDIVTHDEIDRYGRR